MHRNRDQSVASVCGALRYSLLTSGKPLARSQTANRQRYAHLVDAPTIEAIETLAENR